MQLVKLNELERFGVEETLSDILNKPIGIVIAPSGYGKTTVVRSFLQKHPECRNIWLSLGPEEVDEVWVWKRLCNKFKDIDIDMHVYEQITALGLPNSAQDADYFINIIRDNLKQQICIVIDDYHECSSAAINRLLIKLAYEEISLLHIIIIGRIYPKLPYEEMFLKGYCTIVDQRMLGLTREESIEIFRINGIELSQEEAQSMGEYTDGWIAAVYLSLFDYKRTGCFAQFHSVAHLLKTAIFDKFPETMRTLCIKMSIFGIFTPEEAIYVSECNVHPMALIEISERFGFIQYDFQSKRYEMHSLLRSVAVAELDESGYDKQALYKRGAEWNAQNGNHVRAILYYRDAGELRKIFKMLSGDIRTMVFETAPAIVEDIIETAPMKYKIQYMVAYLTYIYNISIKENASKGTRLLDQARKEYEKVYQDKEWYGKLCGEVKLVEAVLQFNDLEKITESIREASRLLEGDTSLIFKQSLLTYGAPQMTMLYYSKVGQLTRTIELEKEYTKYYMYLVGGVKGGWDELFDAEYAMLTGDMVRAFALAKQVEQKSKFRKQTCVVITSISIQLRCLIYHGKPAEFNRKIQELHEYMKDITNTVMIIDYELAYSLVYAYIGKVEEMAGWVKNYELEQCNRIVRSIRSGCLAYGMLLGKTQQWVLLDAVAEQMLVPYEKAKHIYVEICGYLYKTIAAYHLEGIESARDHLKKAISLAEQDSVLIPFIERSEELLPIFNACDKKLPFYRLLEPHFIQYQHSLKLFKKEVEKVTLTKREQEVMDLVKAGYRNAEIGRRMNIASVTVEKNLTTVYRKLKVSNRSAAIAKMVEYNL